MPTCDSGINSSTNTYIIVPAATDILLTASNTIAIDSVIKPITALKPDKNTLAIIPIILTFTISLFLLLFSISIPFTFFFFFLSLLSF